MKLTHKGDCERPSKSLGSGEHLATLRSHWTLTDGLPAQQIERNSTPALSQSVSTSRQCFARRTSNNLSAYTYPQTNQLFDLQFLPFEQLMCQFLLPICEAASFMGCKLRSQCIVVMVANMAAPPQFQRKKKEARQKFSWNHKISGLVSGPVTLYIGIGSKQCQQY